MVEPFEVLTLEQLRARRSIKWTQHAPDVLPLWIAEMDAPLPASVVAALSADLAAGDAGYAPLDTAYAEAFAHVAAARWGWTVDPAATCVCADVLTGITRSLELLTKPGETVLVPAPVYTPLLLLPTSTAGCRSASGARASCGSTSLRRARLWPRPSSGWRDRSTAERCACPPRDGKDCSALLDEGRLHPKRKRRGVGGSAACAS
ncbi:hypothetical protein [Longivirga aurantiaca]|uniref:Aminotransferase class I/classII domain-containing protein n=1 Tax=Longivirga aurantiaca TaxID=1837743 RepID=A0ABW1T5L3_9ACTN